MNSAAHDSILFAVQYDLIKDIAELPIGISVECDEILYNNDTLMYVTLIGDFARRRLRIYLEKEVCG